MRKIGTFEPYRNFSGSIYYTTCELFYGEVEDILPAITYASANILDLEKQFHEKVDTYILESYYLKDIKCSKELILNCHLKCEHCICRDCDNRSTCTEYDGEIGCTA